MLYVVFCLIFQKNCYPYRVFIHFQYCFLGDHGVKSAVTILTKRTHTLTKTGSLGFDTCYNNLTHNGIEAILSIGDMLSCLCLDGNLYSRSSSGFIALKLLTEALSLGTATRLHGLTICACSLTSRHAYHLLLLITQAKNLKELHIGQNQLQESASLLFLAAKYLTSV